MQRSRRSVAAAWAGDQAARPSGSLCSGSGCVNGLLWGQRRKNLVTGLHCLVDGLLRVALLFFSADRVVRVWLVVAGVMYPAIILLHYWLLGRPAGCVGASGIGLIRKTGLNDGFFFLWKFAQA